MNFIKYQGLQEVFYSKAMVLAKIILRNFLPMLLMSI